MMKCGKYKSRLIPLAFMMALSAPVLSHTDSTEGHESEIDYANAEAHLFGKASNPVKAVRTIEIEMSDQMRFTPSELSVLKGDTVRFVVKNGGQLLHEMVLGTEDSLAEHAELMKQFPGMEHDEPHMAHVASGAMEEMGWQFTESGEFFFGCLVPGHFDAGMRGRIIVQ